MICSSRGGKKTLMFLFDYILSRKVILKLWGRGEKSASVSILEMIDPLLLCHLPEWKPCFTSDISYRRFMGGERVTFTSPAVLYPFRDEHILNLIKSLLRL